MTVGDRGHARSQQLQARIERRQVRRYGGQIRQIVEPNLKEAVAEAQRKGAQGASVIMRVGESGQENAVAAADAIGRRIARDQFSGSADVNNSFAIDADREIGDGDGGA